MPSVTIKGWLPNGVAIEVTDEDMTYTNAMLLSHEWLAAGMLTAPPANEGIDRQLIVTVMRREKSDGTPIIDYYPVWGFGTDEPFGTYKSVRKYLNNDGDVDQFLNASGFNSLLDIPLYDGQAPLKRTAGKKHPKETDVPTPFIILRKQGKEKTNSEGGIYREWELTGYEIATQQSAHQVYQNAPESRQNAPNPSAPPQSAPNTPIDTEWTHNAQSVVKFLGWAQNQYGLSHGQVIEALAYFSWNPLTGVDQYEGTKEQAMAACIAFACKYDPASVASLDIAPGLKQLTIEMIELHNVPF